jgi:hypothetical protein
MIRLPGELHIYDHVGREREPKNQADYAETHPIQTRMFVDVG